MDEPIPKEPLLSRRSFLRVAGVSGVGALAATVLRISPVRGLITLAARKPRSFFWNDPATWGGRVPGKNDLAIVSRRIILNVNAHVRGVVIKPGGELIFHPRRQITLRSTGNVVVRGNLRIRPKRPDLIHRLLFPQVDERRFIGGGMGVIPSDVGLWVTDKGRLDIAGAHKVAWTRAAGSIPAGSTTIALQQEPTGWRIGDEVVITPTLSPSSANHDDAYDLSTITAIDKHTGRVTLRSPTAFEHPAVEVKPGVILTAEILNVTRNIQIEGTSSGRSHIWIRSLRAQHLRNVSLRYLGPRKPSGDESPFTSIPVSGRYGLHFHLMKDRSRGSEVGGVIVRDCGNHAFVAHESHGISFRDCITHNTLGDAYWWDPGSKPDAPHAPPTDDVLYDRCVASRVGAGASMEGVRLAGFFLGARSGNVIRNSVAVGVQGHADSCGFLWPETSTGRWQFEGCLAHNNREHGILAWQTNNIAQVIDDFTGFHNGRFGIFNGHYANAFRYNDCTLYGNRSAAILPLARSFGAPVQRFSGLHCDQAGLSAYCVLDPLRIAPPGAAVEFVQCRFRGYTQAAFGFVDQGSPFPNLFRILDCLFEGNEFWLGSTINPASRIQVQDLTRGALTLRRADQPGTFRPEWNASVSPG